MKSGDILRGLLSGASLMALTLGVSSTARGGQTVAGTTVAAVNVVAATSFLWIHDGAVVTGSVTNSSIITNNGTPIGDAQTSAASGATIVTSDIYGILIQKNAFVGGTVSNLGTVDVNFAASETAENTAWGIGVYAGPGDADVTVSNSGTVDVDAVLTSAADGATIRARGIDIHVSGTDANLAVNTLTNTNSGSITVTASITGTASSSSAATALATGVHQIAIGENATVSLTNNGTISVLAIADDPSPFVLALANGISQTAIATGEDDDGNAAVDLTNTSFLSIDVAAQAHVVGTESAFATARVETGIFQSASGTGSDTATLTNSGAISIAADARASATDFALAIAAVSFGISQQAEDGGSATVMLTNTGTVGISAVATAVANGTSTSTALAVAAIAEVPTFTNLSGVASFTSFTSFTSVGVSNGFGVSQSAVTSALVDNSGTLTIAVEARATATDGTDANAIAVGYIHGGIFQGVSGGGDLESATAEIKNTSADSLRISAAADATGLDTAIAVAVVGVGTSDSVGGGIYQDVRDATTLIASVDNSGMLAVIADARAEASAEEGFAFAFAAVAGGIVQNAASSVSGEADPSQLLEVVNSGTMTIGAYAEAVATASSGEASALALVTGIGQNLGADEDVDATARVHNFGTLTIEAVAKAVVGSELAATATAIGIAIAASQTQAFDLDVDNSGSLAVRAVASNASATGNASAVGLTANAGLIGGTIDNSGTFRVLAANPLGLASGQAIGIDIAADVFEGSIVNSGLLSVIAMGSVAISATGVRIAAAMGSTFEPDDERGTITNDGGTLFAGLTHDQGATFEWGTAIDLTGAPNPIDIELKGNGHVFGLILLSEDDTVTVRDGETLLEGGVNNTLIAANGDFRVLDGATVVLGNDNIPANGPSRIIVADFLQEAGAAVGYRLDANDGDPTAGSIFGDGSVTIDGSARIIPLAGLYPNAFTLEDVVEANDPIIGTWTGGVSSDSPLLDPTPIFNADNFDIDVSRVAFGEVPGLTSNQRSLGDAIENVYSTDLDGAFGDLVGSLFAQYGSSYAGALDQLSGASLASGAQVALNSTGTINATLSQWLLGGSFGPSGFQPTNTAALGSASTPEGLIQPAAAVYGMPTEVSRGNGKATWVRAVGTFGNNDGDGNGPGYDADTGAIYVGGDFDAARYHELAGRLRIGALIGYVNTDIDFDNANKLDYEGVQIGGYAGYEVDQHYLLGNAVIGHYWNDSRRAIPLVAATARGGFETDVLSLYGEYGQKFAMHGADLPATVIPFLGVSFVNAWTDSFTETGAGAANLAVGSNSGTSFATTLGVRVNGTYMTADGTVVRPELRLGWEHEFADTHQKLGASFAAAPGTGFNVRGSNDPRDSAVVGIGVTANQGSQYTVSLNYDGRFNGDVDDHTFHGRVRYEF